MGFRELWLDLLASGLGRSLQEPQLGLCSVMTSSLDLPGEARENSILRVVTPALMERLQGGASPCEAWDAHSGQSPASGLQGTAATQTLATTGRRHEGGRTLRQATVPETSWLPEAGMGFGA